MAVPPNPCRSSLGGASRHLTHVPAKTTARFARKKVGGKPLLEGKLKLGLEEIDNFLALGDKFNWSTNI